MEATQTELYGIEMRYANGVTKPVLVVAEIQRVTAKFYIVESRYAFLGYRAQIPKDDKGNLTFFSPIKAWENYASRCRQNVLTMDSQRKEQAYFELVAEAEIAKLHSAGAV